LTPGDQKGISTLTARTATEDKDVLFMATAMVGVRMVPRLPEQLKKRVRRIEAAAHRGSVGEDGQARGRTTTPARKEGRVLGLLQTRAKTAAATEASRWRRRCTGKARRRPDGV
jgi:hypothetical protein